MGRSNNFGVLRLAFALSVILSHAWIAVTGGPDIWTWTFGHGTLGEYAVDAFFLVSGYLITASMLTSYPVDYIIKRVLRLYPAFIVASLVTLFVAVPIAGGSVTGRSYLEDVVRILTLCVPSPQNAFQTPNPPVINGSMWTIV